MTTEKHKLEIELQTLRLVAIDLVTQADESEAMSALSNDKKVLAHAYVLGAMMRATGMAPASLLPLIDFIKLGYHDFDGFHEFAKGKEEIN